MANIISVKIQHVCIAIVSMIAYWHLHFTQITAVSKYSLGATSTLCLASLMSVVFAEVISALKVYVAYSVSVCGVITISM